MSGINRADIKAGTRVQVVQKQDQRSGKLTEGIVKDILTKSATHLHGIDPVFSRDCAAQEDSKLSAAKSRFVPLSGKT